MRLVKEGNTACWPSFNKSNIHPFFWKWIGWIIRLFHFVSIYSSLCQSTYQSFCFLVFLIAFHPFSPSWLSPYVPFPLFPFHSWGFIPSITLYRAMETFHITAEREKWILSNSFSSVSLYWIWMWSIPLPTFLSIYFTVLIFFLFCFFLIHWRR